MGWFTVCTGCSVRADLESPCTYKAGVVVIPVSGWREETTGRLAREQRRQALHAPSLAASTAPSSEFSCKVGHKHAFVRCSRERSIAWSQTLPVLGGADVWSRETRPWSPWFLCSLPCLSSREVCVVT